MSNKYEGPPWPHQVPIPIPKDGVCDTTVRAALDRFRALRDRQSASELFHICQPLIHVNVAAFASLMPDASSVTLHLEAQLGLLLAIERFDATHQDVSFANVAHYWIRARLLRHMLDQRDETRRPTPVDEQDWILALIERPAKAPPSQDFWDTFNQMRDRFEHTLHGRDAELWRARMGAFGAPVSLEALALTLNTSPQRLRRLEMRAMRNFGERFMAQLKGKAEG